MKRNSKIALFCIAAIFLNLFTSVFFFDFLHVPLFMDTIFTVATVFYLGLVPGLIVGILFNIVDTFFNIVFRGIVSPTNVFFSLCGAAIVLVTWLFSRKEEEFKISVPITILYLLLITMLSSLVAIIIGGVIDYIRFSNLQIPERSAPVKKFIDAFLSQNFSLFASCIIAQIPVSFTDRLISTFFGYGFCQLFKRQFGDSKEW